MSVLDPGGLELVMVYLKGGRCSIGSPPNETGRYENEGPVHSVTLDGFWVSCFEVTQAQYEVIMGENPSTFRDPSRPVEMVSWEDAELFCRRASSWIGRTFTLPTEAQWEYACRSGTSASRFWGDDPDAACRYANVSDMTAREKYPEWAVHNCSDGFLGTAPVGSYEPNAFGIYDMIGNVWEWCSDWYDESYYISSPQLNPEGP
ncbi:MAG TPA: SUMF1/EgtB/PvdO family nonheme iron enzyme, partial [bacterium]|nr:SUMF1/EgtB/PvdO family nonheme iron enzyme [bacterium]